MATVLHERAPPRKKIATYGKAARRRIPEFKIAMTRKSSSPERAEEPVPVRKKILTPPLKTKPKPIRQESILQPALSTSSSTTDIWDVPNDEAPKQVRRRATPPAKTKPVPRKSPSVSPPSIPQRDFFDPRSLKTMQKASTNHKLTNVETSESLTEGIKKKLRLSPALDLALNVSPNKATNRQPRSHPAARPPQNRNASLKAGQATRMVARPKIQTLPKKVEVPSNPPRQSPKPPQVEQTAPSTPPPVVSDIGIDTDMVDVEPQRAHISPRGLDMWQGLLDSVEDTEEEMQKHNGNIVSNGGGNRVRTFDTLTHTLSRPAGVSKALPKNQRLLPRRRLIDTLVEQAQEETDDSSEEEDDVSTSDSAPASQPIFDVIMASKSQSAIPEPSKPPLLATENQGSQVGPMITYSRVRSMLNEEDIMKQLEMELPAQAAHTLQTRRPRRVSILSLKPQASSYDADPEDEGTVPAIRSVHELRLAGANNRFLDAIEDFLERIGSPSKMSSSMRRSGLLDMANQMKDKNFCRQFRDHGIEQKLFLHLGQELDIIAGFLMVSLLISVLMDGSMPHIVSQLRRHGITRLIIRLLECQAGITAISKERKSNASKSMQTLILEHHDHLLQLSTWEDLKPEDISPRTLALKCLELMVRQTRQAGLTGEIFSKELTTSLFAIMRNSSDERCWQLPKDKQAIDFYLALSALESHSLTARTVHDESIWISDYLPIIADTLEVALLQPNESYGILQVLLLRLTLNVTNNNPKASEIFIRPSLMSTMGTVTAAKFRQILRFLREEELDAVLEHLVLILGVMINFSEWSSAARESLQSLQGQINDPLELLIRIFTDNRDQTSMADSMEESSKNVAFGYLAVLLGYLALLPAIGDRIRNAQSRKTLKPLVLSIEEFINFHKVVENQQFADDIDGHNPQVKLTERWESLVGKLALLI